MNALPITRRQQAMLFAANTKQLVQLNKSLAYREIGLRLTGGLTLSAANNTQANTLKGDEWGCIKNITVIANSSEILFSCSGDDLWQINSMLYGMAPKISTSLGNGAANPTFDSELIIPFWTPRTSKPIDTLFEAAVGLSDLRLEITWGDHTSINASATAFASGPALEVLSHENELSPYFSPPFIKRTILQQNNFVGAQNAARVNLDIGLPRYLGFLINVTDAAGQDTPGLFTNVKLQSGSTVFHDVAETSLMQWQRLRNAIPFWIEKTPSTGVAAPFNDAFGGAPTGVIADVGGAFAQATLNTNFKELASRVDVVSNLLNGQAFQQQPRISPKSDYRAWYPLLVCTDGFLSEAPDSRGLNELYLEFVTSASANIRVISFQLIPNPRRRVVERFNAAA